MASDQPEHGLPAGTGAGGRTVAEPARILGGAAASVSAGVVAGAAVLPNDDTNGDPAEDRGRPPPASVAGQALAPGPNRGRYGIIEPRNPQAARDAGLSLPPQINKM